MNLSPKTTEDEDAIEIMLAKRADQLTTWEVGFLVGLAEQDQFTERQRDIFERLWTRVA